MAERGDQIEDITTWWSVTRRPWNERTVEHFASRLTWWDWGNIADALRERIQRWEAGDYNGVFSSEATESDPAAKVFIAKDLERMRHIAAIAGDISDLLNEWR